MCARLGEAGTANKGNPPPGALDRPATRITLVNKMALTCR
jgi:hypothetical protein